MTLTLPLTVGQRVTCRDGEVREVKTIGPDGDVAYYTDGRCVWLDIGKGNKVKSVEYGWDAVADAPPALTLPLTDGQRVVSRDGAVGVYTDEGDVTGFITYVGRGRWYVHAETGMEWEPGEGIPRYERDLDAVADEVHAD